ncbi:MAG TPA: glycosyltransferase family 4 protein [Gemmatimonadaceae bacterium]|nr:glycosyltransferase family 4 protein [Gemmatimonadaceae bacterium]
MRALFYSGETTWSGCARTFVAAARGLAAREHSVTVVCCGGSVVERTAMASGLDVLPIDGDASAVGDAWWLRRVMQQRSIETAFVHTDREQLVVSSAMRLAERGGVVRRVPSFRSPDFLRRGRFAARMAATGLLFSSERELQAAKHSPLLAALPIPSTVAPLGVDATAYDDVRPAVRASIGAPGRGLLIACPYDPGSRIRLATAMRTLALLLPRHPEIHLAVLGPGSLDEDLQMHAAALGLSTFVAFLGQRDDATSILRASDVVWVTASGDEGAFAFLDAMAMRIPVLAERGEMPQHYVADGITGVLLSPGAPSHTAASVAAFLANQERRTAMGNAGRTRVQREFPERAMIDGFELALHTAGDRARWTTR